MSGRRFVLALVVAALMTSLLTTLVVLETHHKPIVVWDCGSPPGQYPPGIIRNC